MNSIMRLYPLEVSNEQVIPLADGYEILGVNKRGGEFRLVVKEDMDPDTPKVLVKIYMLGADIGINIPNLKYIDSVVMDYSGFTFYVFQVPAGQGE